MDGYFTGLCTHCIELFLCPFGDSVLGPSWAPTAAVPCSPMGGLATAAVYRTRLILWDRPTLPLFASVTALLSPEIEESPERELMPVHIKCTQLFKVALAPSLSIVPRSGPCPGAPPWPMLGVSPSTMMSSAFQRPYGSLVAVICVWETMRQVRARACLESCERPR